jgi:hypothetical protein
MANYTDLATLRKDATFKARVEIAVAKYALYIMDESPAMASHKVRFAWASNALLNPGSVGEGLIPSIVLDGTVAAAYASKNQADITDAQLQSAVEASVNRFLNT